MSKSAQDARVELQIEAWRNDLINLTRRNGLLYYKPTRSTTLELREPDVLKVVGRLHSKPKTGWAFYEPPEPAEEDDSRTPLERKPLRTGELLTQKRDAASLRSTLRGLERRANQEYLDKGLWVLYLGAGMLYWEDPETNEMARSPLVLYPVSVQRESPRSPYRLVLSEDDAVANPALAVKLEADFGVELPRLDDFDDLAGYFGKIGAMRRVRSNGWRVEPEGVIRTFSFHKEVMYRDLQVNEAAIADHAVARALALGPDADEGLAFDAIEDRDLDAACPPEKLTAILDADATQRRCIAAAALGHSFVMDGPPGTGKSQTIANLIASSIELGKTVLFVSEKAAALDVVSSRLEALGLGEYLLELHSHKATRKQFAYEMAAALDRQPVPPDRLSSESLESVKEKREQLSAYALAMNQTREPLERTLHDVIGRISSLEGVPEAPVPTAIDASLTSHDLREILEAARRWARAWGPVEKGDDFVWRGSVFAGTDVAEIQQIERDLDEALGNLDAFRQAAEWIADDLGFERPGTTSDGEATLRVLDLLEHRSDVPPSWLTSANTETVHNRIAQLRSLEGHYNDNEELLVELIGNDWVDLDPAAGDRLAAAVAAYAEAGFATPLADSADSGSLGDLAGALNRIGAILDELAVDSEQTARSFGGDGSPASIADSEVLAKVAALIGEGPDPAEDWLDAVALARTRESASHLQEAVSDYLMRREELTPTFTDEVLDLDLEGLSARYDQVHHGLRKLAGSYRDDKRTVAAVSRTEKAPKDVTGRLPEALEWQRSRDRWRESEGAHAAAVGEHYYQQDRTDFETIAAAMDRAELILDTGQGLVGASGLREHFGAGCTPDSLLKERGIRTVANMKRLREEADSIGLRLDGVLGLSIESAHLWLASLQQHLQEVLTEVQAVDAVAGKTQTLAEALRSLAERRGIDETLTLLLSTKQADEELLGSAYAGLGTDWGTLERGLAWADEMREEFDGHLDAAVAAALLSTGLRSDALRSQTVAWQKSRTSVAAGFDEPHSSPIAEELEGYFGDASELLRALRSTTGDIQEWAAFRAARTELEDRNLDELAEFCVVSSIPRSDVEPVIEWAVLVRWVDAVLSSDDRLRPERSNDRDAILDDFRELDQQLARHSVARVIRSCNDRRPATTQLGGAALIRREGEKKSRHRPIRTLMAEARQVIQAVKPCFMMSPLTVSQYLDPDMRFDIVIFDEASQVLPADAINCIYRGKQVVIAGDQKQLPPTTFFQRMGDDDESAEFDEDELDQFESILDIAKGSGLSSLPLLWHYRSRHESLITYSNFGFYNGDLVTYPGATELGQHVGVELFKVDGIYRRGTSRDNPVEAEKVAERVLFHARQNPDLTVGVVAFSEAQASLIQEVIDQKRREHPELDSYFTDDRLSGFFVKNLENVQGDERDIMIFSIGYGPDEMGSPVKGNFGPLTRAGGERRLNVAITRARQRVEVVSSIDSSDFKSSWASDGARHLKRYLDFAERGMPALALDLHEADAEPESPFEEDVLAVIRGWGFDAVPQVGTAGYRIDIGVRDPAHPGRYAIGIECDGAMYHSSQVARDRDRLRQEVLEGLGWSIYRIWGTSWYRNRETEVARLKFAIESSIDSGSGKLVNREQPRIEVAIAEVDHSASPDWVEPYEIALPRVPRHLAMSDGSARPALQDAIREVVAVESPVFEDVVLGRVREAWDVGRAGRLIREAFHGQLRVLVRNDAVTMDRRRVLWRPDGVESLAVRVPIVDEASTVRNVTQVPVEELQLAIVQLLRDSISADRDELTALVSKLFGWRRRGSEISTALKRAVTALLRSGRIERDGDRLRAAQL